MKLKQNTVACDMYIAAGGERQAVHAGTQGQRHGVQV